MFSYNTQVLPFNKRGEILQYGAGRLVQQDGVELVHFLECMN